MTSVIVTGATSMLGGALIRCLLRQNIKKIFSVVQPDSKNIGRLPKDDRIVMVECACDNYKMLPKMIGEECEAFYHFAWLRTGIKGRKRYFDIEAAYKNIGQCLDALDAAGKLQCRNFIMAGSQAEYGALRNQVQKPEDLTDPVTAYGIAKDSSRRMCMLKAREIGVSVQWVRIFSVYGPNDRDNTMITSMLRKMQRNEPAELTKCEQIWDYLYEDDAGEGLYYIGKYSKDSNLYCLGSGEARPLKEYVLEMKRICNSESSVCFGAVPYTEDVVMNLHADISKIKENTGWKGPSVSFEEGIRRIIEGRGYCK